MPLVRHFKGGGFDFRPRFSAGLMLVLILLVAAVGGLVGFSRQNAADNPTRIPSPLSISDSALNIGEVHDRPTIDCTLPVTNTSSSEINCHFATSCNCAALSPASLVIAPGETKPIVVTMKMPAARQHGTQVVQSEICAEFVGLELPRQSWTLTAISRRTFILEPAAIDFGQELRVNGPPISRAIVIHSAVPVRHVEVLNDTGALVVTSPTNDDSGCRFSFSCSISPDLLKQSCDFGTKLRLLITTDAVGDPVALEIPVRITVKHDVEAESPTSYLGTSPIGSIAEGNIHLNSFRAEPFRVESISGFPEAVAVVGTNLGRCDMDFTVRIKVEQLGAFRGEARFTVFDQFEAHAYTVVVPVIAIGTGK